MMAGYRDWWGHLVVGVSCVLVLCPNVIAQGDGLIQIQNIILHGVAEYECGGDTSCCDFNDTLCSSNISEIDQSPGATLGFYRGQCDNRSTCEVTGYPPNPTVTDDTGCPLNAITYIYRCHHGVFTDACACREAVSGPHAPVFLGPCPSLSITVFRTMGPQIWPY